MRTVRLVFSTVCAILCGGLVNATSVTVQELGVSPREIVKVDIEYPGTSTDFYRGNVYAGVVNLLVDGTPMDAFCIDPFHFSKSSTLTYDAIPLMDGPKSPGGAMGADKAALISKLWTLNYSPSITSRNAAGLQLAIWEVIGGVDFTILSTDDFGSSAMLTAANAYSGPVASLIALTGDGQDYVIAVPEGGATVILFGIGILCLARLKKHVSA